MPGICARSVDDMASEPRRHTHTISCRVRNILSCSMTLGMVWHCAGHATIKHTQKREAATVFDQCIAAGYHATEQGASAAALKKKAEYGLG